ncbi:MAG TPA: hypothetical protein VGE01_11900 [Fimbriimonas sp.]
MKRPDPTRRQVERYAKASKFRYRAELVLDFDHPIPIAKGREFARRALDSLQATCEVEDGEACGEMFLTCSELRRLVKIRVVPREPEG